MLVFKFSACRTAKPPCEPCPLQWGGCWMRTHLSHFFCILLFSRRSSATFTALEVERRLSYSHFMFWKAFFSWLEKHKYTLHVHTCVHTSHALIIIYKMAIIIFLICTRMVEDTKGMEGTEHNIPQQGHKSCILAAPPTHTHQHTHTHRHTSVRCALQ